MSRVFYYALGGGFGHLTRSLAVVHTLRLAGPVRMVVSIPAPELQGIKTPPQVELLAPPSGLDPSSGAEVGSWIAAAAADFAPDEWFVDCFPAGLLGELPAGSSGVPRCLVTRWVQWAAYRRRTPAIGEWPRYARIHATEPLGQRQAQDLGLIGPAPIDLELRDPCDPSVRATIDRLVESLGREDLSRAWLVVHSGPIGEVEQVLARALADGGSDRKVLLVTPDRACPGRLPSTVIHCAVYPVWPLFDQVERIYTAAGANSIRQLAPFRERHVAVPLRRRLDDQVWRARACATDGQSLTEPATGASVR